MPTPKQWTSSSKLLDALKRCDWQAWFNQGRTEEASGTWTDLITRAVGGNTFRAFRGLPKPPSQVFRSWAHDELLKKGYFDWLLAVATQDQYNLWLAALAEDLRSTWKAEEGKQMPYGPSMKLPSLVAKRACLSPQMPSRQFEGLVWFLHVPLDSYTIQAVRRCAAAFWGARLIGAIPSGASMGFVSNPGSYYAFQEGIKSLAADAQVPPIALDVLAWDYSRP